MSSNAYTLYTYDFNGKQVTSAIHWLDIAKFLKEHPDAQRRM